jgi:DhnA family fructose-bisphosphate aldolase class Ia
MYANSNLDIPAISFDLERIANEDGYLIIDVGGDDAGATALGMYAHIFSSLSDNIDMLCVVNKYRYMTRSADEAVELLYEIEKSARTKHTGIINNSNLGYETTAETVENSMDFAEKICEKTGLPLVYTVCKNSLDISVNSGKVLPVEIYVKPIWQD